MYCIVLYCIVVYDEDMNNVIGTVLQVYLTFENSSATTGLLPEMEWNPYIDKGIVKLYQLRQIVENYMTCGTSDFVVQL